jgi:hypothetical protein
MGNYWLDLEKVEEEKSFIKPKSGYGVTLEVKDDHPRGIRLTSASGHTIEMLARAAEIQVVAPSASFSLDGLELIKGPDCERESPVSISGGIYANCKWRTPIRLRATMHDRYLPSEMRLHEWLGGWLASDNIPELSNVVLYVKNENNLQEAWVLTGVFPRDVEWSKGSSVVEFTLGYENLKQRRIVGASSNLLA